MADRKNEAVWTESRQRWQINVQHDCERKTFVSSIPGTKGKVEAEKKADKWLEDGSKVQLKRFAATYDAFIEQAELLTGTANHAQLECLGRLYLKPVLGNKRLTSITGQDWQDCINYQFKAGKSKKTLKDLRGCMTRFCRYCKKNRYKIEPPEDLVIPDSAPVGEKTILQPDKLKILMSDPSTTFKGKVIDEFYIHAWRFIVLTGLRRGELLGLKKKEVTDTIATVKRSINSYNEETNGKNKNARRAFAIGELVKGVLADQAKMLKEKGIKSVWAFPNESGERSSPYMFHKRWEKYRKIHGITCSLHELRHTMISYSQEVPLELLKKQVGHGPDMDTFGQYGHEVDGEKERTAVLINDAFKKILE